MRILVFLMATLLLALPARAETRTSTFDKVFSANELTCASFVFNGLFEPDANTGKPKGFFADVMAEAGARLGVRINYAELASFATGFEELKSGRYDMLCASLASFPMNYSKMLFSTALFYDPIFLWGDSSRDYSAIKSLEDVNNPQWRIAGMDGELGGIFGPVFFPKATMHMVGQSAPAGTILMDLATNKADFVMLTKAAALAYEAANPGKLQQILAIPAASYPIRFVFKPEDDKLRDVFDMVFADMKADGTLQRLIAKYGLQ